MSGRPPIKGISAQEKMFVRRGYTYELKQAVLEEVKASGTEVAVKRFFPDAQGRRRANIKRMVRRWMRESENFWSGSNTSSKEDEDQTRRSKYGDTRGN
jgi:hypothetical protein